MQYVDLQQIHLMIDVGDDIGNAPEPTRYFVKKLAKPS